MIGYGSVFSNLRTFDPVGNVGSVITTHAAVAGQSTSGGSSTQIFCYDEENRLVWAGDSSTAPAAGNGTCGSGTPANTLQGTSYNTNYAYTHLGQTWQSPLNGGITQQQYLYCDSSHPHQLSGVYTVSSATTCANKGSATASYATGYDAWGNQTTRSYNGQTAILSFDGLDELTQWNAGSTSQGWYAYDNTSSRVLQRSTTSSGTTITVYAFGSEEHVYNASGAKLSDTYYYMLGGRLLGQYNGVTTQFYLTDALGSVVSTFDDTVGSAAILGNQAYGPYGKKIYSAGSMGTNKGYTGQYQDATGLDYYHARYYDAVIGRFVSADSVQGNTSGMDPYDYVGGNPETRTDPTGQRSVGCDPGLAYCGNEGPPAGGGHSGGGDGGNGNGSTTTTGPVGCQATWDCYPDGYQPQTPQPQPPATDTGHANPKIVTVVTPPCDNNCGDNARKRLRTGIAADEKISQARVNLTADIVSVIADGVAAGVDIATGIWGGLAIDVLSLIAHIGSIIIDLSNLGIMKVSADFVSAVGLLKNLAYVLDTVKGIFDIWDEGIKGLSKFIIPLAKGIARKVEGIADLAPTAAGGLAGIYNYGAELVYFNRQNDIVNNSSNSDALAMCVSRYGSSQC